MAVSASDVKALREATGAGMMDCKKALTEADGNMEKTTEILREKGLLLRRKIWPDCGGRRCGQLYPYGWPNQRVLVEVNCRNGLCGKNGSVPELCARYCNANRGFNPLCCLRKRYRRIQLIKKKEILRIRQSMKENQEKDRKQYGGRSYKKYFKEVCLLDQPFVKDPDKTLPIMSKSRIAALGENITIRRFTVMKWASLQKRR